MTKRRIMFLRRRLQESRHRLLLEDAEFTGPLREMRFVAVPELWHMSANGKNIYFNPDWLKNLGTTALDFMLCHELMHIALGHLERSAYFKGERFHLACDIVVNARLRDRGWTFEKLPHVGKIYVKTFFPETDGALLTAEEAFSRVPFDPAALPAGQRQKLMIDSDLWWDLPEDRGQGGTVVLGPEDEDPPDLTEERELAEDAGKEKRAFPGGPKPPVPLPAEGANALRDTLAALRDMKQRSGESREALEGLSERIWQRPGNAVLNWRRLLRVFVQESVCDYSFTPPDRRFHDADFFLPDYHSEPGDTKEILFFVDTSGSVDDETLSTVYAELASAFEQFGGSLKGRVAFFDTQVYPLQGFGSVEELAVLQPRGGGGTDLSAPFVWLGKHSASKQPAGIVICTDGRGAFPPESAAMNIPVLWLLTENNPRPEWGQAAYIHSGLTPTKFRL